MERLNEHKKKIAITLTLVALGVGLTYTYFASGSRSTENAYINADVVSVAAQVSGRVVAVHIKDNQQVKKGEALFDIDPEPFAIALERPQADLAQARQNGASG